MCFQEHNEEHLKLSSLGPEKVPTAAATAEKVYSTPPKTWDEYEPSKLTLLQPTPCYNCIRLKGLLLSIAVLAIFSPILIYFKGPLYATEPALQITIRLLFYSAACFPVAGIAVSYDILRKQPYRNVCVVCFAYAAATAVALRGLSCLHSTALPSAQTAGTVEFWAHCVHGVLLRPALWITGGELDDFPLSADARVQIWMLCMLCSAVMGLTLGFGLGKATSSSSNTSCVEKTSDTDHLDTFFLKYDGKIHPISIKSGGGIGKTGAAGPPAVVVLDPYMVQKRRLSTMEACFISACSLSGFWLLLTVVGTFAAP